MRSSDSIKRDDRGDREYFIGFIDDLREVESRAFHDVSCIIGRIDHLPVCTKIEPTDDKVRYTDVGAPRDLVAIAPSLSG